MATNGMLEYKYDSVDYGGININFVEKREWWIETGREANEHRESQGSRDSDNTDWRHVLSVFARQKETTLEQSVQLEKQGEKREGN